MLLTLVTKTPYKQRWLLEQAFEGSVAETITAAQLLAACKGGGPLQDMPGIGSDIAGLNQAGARQAMLGWGTAGEDLTNAQHAACKITPVAGANIFGVDADVDAVNALRCELNLTCEADTVASAILEIAFQHTYDR